LGYYVLPNVQWFVIFLECLLVAWYVSPLPRYLGNLGEKVLALAEEVPAMIAERGRLGGVKESFQDAQTV